MSIQVSLQGMFELDNTLACSSVLYSPLSLKTYLDTCTTTLFSYL